MSISNQVACVLVDAENTNPNDFELIMTKILSEWEDVPVRRLYGDFRTMRKSKWATQTTIHSFLCMQQNTIVKGKNTSDIALAVDAMDILYREKDMNVFILVSSDSDFLPLVVRLKEKRKMVVGIGMATTPESFVKTCNMFLFVEHLKTEMEDMNKEHDRKALLQVILDCMQGKDLVNAGQLNEKLLSRGVNLGNKNIKNVVTTLFKKELNFYCGKEGDYGPYISRTPMQPFAD